MPASAPPPTGSRKKRRFSRAFIPVIPQSRYDYYGQGRTAIACFMALFVATAFVYYLLHVAHPPADTAPEPRELVSVSQLGIVTVTSPEDIDWYVGKKAEPILARISQHNQEIVSTYTEVRDTAARLASAGGPEIVDAVSKLLAALNTPHAGRGDPGYVKRALAHRELANTLQALSADVAAVRSIDLMERQWIDDLDQGIGKLRTAAGYRMEGGGYDPDLSPPLRTAMDGLWKTFETRRPSFGPVPVRSPTTSTATNASPSDRARVIQLEHNAALIAGWLERQNDPLIHFDRFLAQTGRAATGATLSSLSEGLRAKVARLVSVRQDQNEAIDALRPPVKLTFFWMSPKGVLAEVLFWGAFGVLTNLLLNLSEAVRQSVYRPRELGIALTKLIYGPFIALVLCLTILTGLMNLGGYEIRAWCLPLVSFFFGFNARKSAALVDRLSEKVFGSAAASIEQGPEAVARARQQVLERYLDLIKPVSLAEVRDTAKRAAEDTVRHIVLNNEANH